MVGHLQYSIWLLSTGTGRSSLWIHVKPSTGKFSQNGTVPIIIILQGEGGTPRGALCHRTKIIVNTVVTLLLTNVLGR
jgi:hypothetical protein